MSRPVYTPFTQEDQQKPADTTIQSLLDQVSTLENESTFACH